ncbi:MAG: hypothetical protein JRH20_15300 [Deltaproteobacteria bacterium]|nr:hypothetical protein [Deltaproteobacteria bacterium]
MTDTKDTKNRGLSSDQLLGPLHGDEPSSKDLVNALDAKADARRAAHVHTYLMAHPELKKATRAGLEEAKRISAADEGEASLSVLAIELPPLRAAAATPAAGAPFPDDHQTLHEDAVLGFGLSYFRRAHESFIGLFTANPNSVVEFIECLVEGEAQPVQEHQPGETLVCLGNTHNLLGKTVVIVIVQEDQRREFTLSVVPV